MTEMKIFLFGVRLSFRLGIFKGAVSVAAIRIVGLSTLPRETSEASRLWFSLSMRLRHLQILLGK